jgi:hypothetical protein
MMARGLTPAMDGGGNKLSRHLPRSSVSIPSAPAGALGTIRIIRDLLGQSDMQTAVIYAQWLRKL